MFYHPTRQSHHRIVCRVTNAVGNPTQKTWAKMADANVGQEKGGVRPMAESGMTTWYITAYTASP
jgi:hypothetical protein